ncbi:MAG: type III-B CRISPR module RAMP protein Cmr6 [candidate division WOR-3 bacterium]
MQNYNNNNRRNNLNRPNQGNNKNQNNQHQIPIIKCYPKDTSNLIKSEQVKNLNIKYQKLIEFKINNKMEMEIEKKILKENNITKFDNKLELPNLDKIELIAETRPKLIIGFGSESVYETSLTLHHVYGVPYIPGSALKGSFRSFIIRKFFENNEKEALKDANFRNIFGGNEQQERQESNSEKGNVVFFDSFPEDSVAVVADILTPHFNNYYQHQNPPTDTENPNPKSFLSVEGKFRIVIGIKENCEEILFDKPKKEFLKKELKDMLENFGVGAKTSVGYGYFKIVG